MGLEDRQALVKSEIKVKKKTYVIGYKTKSGKRNFTPKQQSVVSQVENGTKLRTAIRAAGYSEKSVVPLSYKFRNYLLTEPKRFKKLSNCVDGMIDDFMNGNTDLANNVERLYMRGLDTVQPKVNYNENKSLTVNIDVVNMVKYRCQVGVNAEKEP